MLAGPERLSGRQSVGGSGWVKIRLQTGSRAFSTVSGRTPGKVAERA